MSIPCSLYPLLLTLCCCLAFCQARIAFTFSPDPIIIKTDSNTPINVTLSALAPVPDGDIIFSIKDLRIARLPIDNETSIKWSSSSMLSNQTYQLTIRGVRLGWTNLEIDFRTNNVSNSEYLNITKTQIAVLRDQTVAQLVYRVILIICVVILTIGMGCTIDIHIVFKLLKRPVGLAVGWCTQFILMPNLGVAVGQLLLLLVTDLDNASAFAYGILTMGCAPGGGGSNVWTLLFDGDLDLSMTMTFISQLCALFMMPLWLFAYSRLYVDVDKVRVPFDQVALNLLQVVIPVLVGVFIKLKWPNIGNKIARAIKPFTLFFILFVIGFGTYVNFFLYELIGQLPIIIPFAALLPWLGFLFSYIVTLVLRLGRKQAIAIALEAGIQNVGIPILVLQFSMPKPDGDLAAIVPLIVVLVTPVPLYFLLAFKRIRERIRRKKEYGMAEGDGATETDGTIYPQADAINEEGLKSGRTVDMSDYAQIQHSRSTNHLVALDGNKDN